MATHRWSGRHREGVSYRGGVSAAGDALLGAGGLVALAPVSGVDVRAVSTALPLPPYRPPAFVASERPEPTFAEDVQQIETLDEAVTAARRHLYRQLRRGARAMGADAVVGIHRIRDPSKQPYQRIDLARAAARLRPGPHPYLSTRLEHQLIGLAVRDPSNASPTPELSGVSPADLWRLRNGGWRPIGLVGGCGHRFGASLWSTSGGQEIHGSTAVWTAARQAAFAQLKLELDEVAADGVIGIETQASHERFDWTERVEILSLSGRRRRRPVARQGVLVSISMSGTALRRTSASPDRELGVIRTMNLR